MSHPKKSNSSHPKTILPYLYITLTAMTITGKQYSVNFISLGVLNYVCCKKLTGKRPKTDRKSTARM
jgi:hypothetical protein